MNATTFAASCAFLGALSLSSHSVHSAAPSRATATPSTEWTTIVIRYDPEAIFLTHDLVAPICSTEVELEDDAAGGVVGELVMKMMNSNGLQPRGVFVGSIGVKWASGETPPPERREAVLENGLEQLRSALAGRLVQPRRDQLRRSIVVLEAMEDELRNSADVKARELARREELAVADRELEQATVTRRAGELELRVAQQELLIASTKVQEVEAKLEIARATVDQVRAELERVRELAGRKVISELDLRTAEQQVLSAETELDVASAHVENQRMQVAQRRTQVEAAEETLALLDAKITELETRITALSTGGESGTIAALRLDHATDHGRLTELGTELQRARAALATVTDVTVERW